MSRFPCFYRGDAEDSHNPYRSSGKFAICIVTVPALWRASVLASTPVVSIRPFVVYSTNGVLARTLARQRDERLLCIFHFALCNHPSNLSLQVERACLAYPETEAQIAHAVPVGGALVDFEGVSGCRQVDELLPAGAGM